MRKFLTKLSKFFLPSLIVALIFVVSAEIKLNNYPSNFNIKAKYLQNNLDSIELLVLGTSHNANAINPELIKQFKVSNIAIGGQTLKIDSFLLNKFINKLPNLKVAVIELSYHSLEEKENLKYFRNSLYLRSYNINLFGRKPLLKDYSIFLSNPKYYTEFLNPFTKANYSYNKYGFLTAFFVFNNTSHRFKNLNYNEKVILNDTNNYLITRHKYEDLKAFKKNKKRIKSMIELCIKNNIIPIIIKPPVFKSYSNGYIKSKDKRRKLFLDFLEQEYPTLKILDFEKTNILTIKDFRNDDHLNIQGGNKFSKLLNTELNNVLRVKM